MWTGMTPSAQDMKHKFSWYLRIVAIETNHHRDPITTNRSKRFQVVSPPKVMPTRKLRFHLPNQAIPRGPPNTAQLSFPNKAPQNPHHSTKPLPIAFYFKAMPPPPPPTSYLATVLNPHTNPNQPPNPHPNPHTSPPRTTHPQPHPFTATQRSLQARNKPFNLSSKKTSAEAESYEERQRREAASRVLESTEMLIWWAGVRNEVCYVDAMFYEIRGVEAISRVELS